jgi:hypothetical protein
MAGATAGRGRLRASHADREHVIDVLKTAFVQGRLSKEEFDMRVGQTFASRTYAELAALTADIPARLSGARPLRGPARTQGTSPQNKTVNSLAGVTLALVALAVALSVGSGLFFLVAVVVIGVFFVAGGRTVHASRKRRSSRQQ